MQAKKELIAQIKGYRIRLKDAGVNPPRFNMKGTNPRLMAHAAVLKEMLIDAGAATEKDKVGGKEVYAPEEAAAILVESTDQFQTLKQLGEEAGLKPGLISALVKRVKAKAPAVVGEVKRLNTSQMIAQLNEKISMTLEHIDPYTLAQASFRDLTIGLGILIEKQQLLSGEPTQILSLDERKNLNQMLPALIAESQRRGITIDQVDNEAIRTILPDEVPEEQLNSTARRIRPEEVENNF